MLAAACPTGHAILSTAAACQNGHIASSSTCLHYTACEHVSLLPDARICHANEAAALLCPIFCFWFILHHCAQGSSLLCMTGFLEQEQRDTAEIPLRGER